MVENFVLVEENYYSIMKEILRLSKKGIDKKELLLELDFGPSRDGTVAPALREPPKFKVARAPRYFEGSRKDEPDWFGKGTPAYKACITPWLHDLKTQFQTLTDDHLFVISRGPHPQVGSIMLITPLNATKATGVSKYSSQTLDAIDRAINGGNVSALERALGEDDPLTVFLKSKIEKELGET